jgi:hypothetical protein
MKMALPRLILRRMVFDLRAASRPGDRVDARGLKRRHVDRQLAGHARIWWRRLDATLARRMTLQVVACGDFLVGHDLDLFPQLGRGEVRILGVRQRSEQDLQDHVRRRELG